MAAGCLIFIDEAASVEQLLEKVPPLLVMAVIVGVMYLPMSLAAVSTVSGCLVVHPDRLLEEADSSIQGLHQLKVVMRSDLLLAISAALRALDHRWIIGIHWWSILPGRADAGSSDCFVSMDRDTTTQGQLVGEAMEDLDGWWRSIGNSIWRTFCSCQNTKREILYGKFISAKRASIIRAETWQISFNRRKMPQKYIIRKFIHGMQVASQQDF